MNKNVRGEMTAIVLNKNGYYHDEVTNRKIIQWLWKENKIEILVSNENEFMRGPNGVINKPLVIKLCHFGGFKNKTNVIHYKDQHVYSRDRNVCQYWHYNENGKRYKHQCNFEDRTIDHVQPRSRKGETSFTNCVCCCKDHNAQKGNRTPEEANLELIRKPFVPKIKKGDYVIMRFVYNPNKLSHKYYYEKVLNKKFSNVVDR